MHVCLSHMYFITSYFVKVAVHKPLQPAATLGALDAKSVSWFMQDRRCAKLRWRTLWSLQVLGGCHFKALSVESDTVWEKLI